MTSTNLSEYNKFVTSYRTMFNILKESGLLDIEPEFALEVEYFLVALEAPDGEGDLDTSPL